MSNRSKKPAKRAPLGAATAESVAPVVQMLPEERQRMVTLAAYFRAEKRGFERGHELEDWLQAEAEVDRRLQQVTAPGG